MTLSDYLGPAVSSTTTLVDNLEAKGTARRERSVEDRREMMLQFTKEGMQDYEVTLILPISGWTEFVPPHL